MSNLPEHGVSGVLPVKVWFNGERWSIRAHSRGTGFSWFYEDRTVPYEETGLTRTMWGARRRIKRARRCARKEKAA